MRPITDVTQVFLMIMGLGLAGMGCQKTGSAPPPAAPTADEAQPEMSHTEILKRQKEGTWKETKEWTLGLARVSGMYLRDGILTVLGSDYEITRKEAKYTYGSYHGATLLRIQARDGKMLERVSISGTGFGARSIAESDGLAFLMGQSKIFILDKDNHAIPLSLPKRFSKSTHFNSIVVSGSWLFAYDLNTRSIWRMELTWEGNNAIPKIVGEPNRIQNPEWKQGQHSPHLTMYVDSDNWLRVANPAQRRIETYSLQGAHQLDMDWNMTGVVPKGYHNCCEPSLLVQFPEGRWVTGSYNAPSIKLYTEEGKLIAQIVGRGSFTRGHDIQALATDESRVFVLDGTRRSIRVFQETYER